MQMRSFFRAFIAIVFLSSVWTAPAVSVSSFSPTVGSPGEQVQIQGSGFYPGTLVVRFNGVQDTTAQATSQDGTSIMAKVPVGATTGPISVSVNGGAAASSADDFTVIGAGPYVLDFSPFAGSDGTQVLIDGLHFTSATSALFGGKPGTMFFVQSDSRIQVNAPVGVTNGPITITSPNGNFVSSNFFVTPVVTGFSPSLGRANTNVTISGNNLLGATNATMNGLALILGPATNNTSLKVTLPVGVATGPVRVNTPAGSSTTTSNLVIQPTLFGFSPGAGSVGSSIVLNGANFNVGTPIVRFSGVASTNVTGISFGQLTAVVPVGASNGLISITTTAGSHTNSTMFFLPPIIRNLGQQSLPPGSTINITGENLLGVTNVSFNGTPARFTAPASNTSLDVVTPTNFTTGPVFVSTPGGTAASSNLYYAMPIITGFSPTHGLPGTNITITGSNFLGTTSVKFNGTTAAFTTPTNNTTIQAVVPTNALSGFITVSAPAGTATSSNAFVFDNSDLSLMISASPNPVFIGSNLTYVLTVTNLGSASAPNVRLTNTFAPSMVLKSASSSQGSLITNSSQVIAILGSLDVGNNATVMFGVIPQIAGNVTNVAFVTSGYPDPFASNNTAVNVTTVLPLPILSVSLLSQNQIRLSWPVALTNFSLESRTNLLLGGWSSILTAPVISGNQRVVTQTNSGAASFYHLKSP
jgi:hypothetical protein